MAIDYTVQDTILNDAQFTSRCDKAVVKAATDISGEAIGAMSQVQTDKRQALAHQVLSAAAGGRIFQAFRNAALANIGVGISTAVDGSSGEISDVEIDTAVASVWDDVAGVTTSDLP